MWEGCGGGARSGRKPTRAILEKQTYCIKNKNPRSPQVVHQRRQHNSLISEEKILLLIRGLEGWHNSSCMYLLRNQKTLTAVSRGASTYGNTDLSYTPGTGYQVV